MHCRWRQLTLAISISASDDRTLKVWDLDRPELRHYIDYDETGVARIYLSRLVNVTPEPRSKAG